MSPFKKKENTLIKWNCETGCERKKGRGYVCGHCDYCGQVFVLEMDGEIVRHYNYIYVQIRVIK